jgi:O-methyltransferase involved in polyketide biosynthesis
MANKVDIQNLGHVQKTMFLPLWGRAVESKKPNPMLIDETAVKIMERVDYDFSPMAQNIDAITHIGWIMRSIVCDRTVREFLQRYPEGTIVNIGCGLDTTYERTDNGKLKWYDLDLPDVIQLRRNFVKESERRKFIVASFLEDEWLEKIEVRDNVLFLVAGVFYYFLETDVKNFLIRLTDRFPGSEILFDVTSPIGVKIANKKVVESSGLGDESHLVWGLKSKKEILAWDPRIKLLGTYYFFRTLRIGLRNYLLGLFSDLLGIQYMLHLSLGS